MKSVLKNIIGEKLVNLLRKFFLILKLPFSIDRSTKNFIEHNKKIWGNFSKNIVNAEILLEFNEMNTSIISYSYFSNILAQRHNAAIKAYSFGENQIFKPSTSKVYKSFNAKVFSYDLSPTQLLELGKLFDDIYSKLDSKNDVFKLTVSGVWLGDLLYDFHLRTHSVPTVEIRENKFKRSLEQALYQFIYWRDYFINHNVKAICVTHCAYLIAIPMRIAIQRGISAYQINVHGCYSMTEKRLWAYIDYYDYPIQFGKLSEQEQTNGLKLAEKRIAKRFAGEVGVDMSYSTKSAYTKIKKNRVLSGNKAFKILIANHCFFDAPNGFGSNLFPDFFEWLTFLGQISEKTDYEWYIKTHPDFLPGTMSIIKEFINKYPKFNLIPSDTSHHQLINEGIDCGLTVYGTIGWEYAALGKLVVNASLSNPHIAYDFNIHPKSIDNYEKILMNLPEQKLDIDIDKVYEYYYMKFRRDNMQNWLFRDFDSFIENIGGYDKQFTSISYRKFLEQFSQNMHNQSLSLLNNFIDSKDYCMQKKHYLN